MSNDELTIPGKMPISAKKANIPIIATERWVKTSNNELRKKYLFKSFNEKRSFIIQILDYEMQTQHPTNIVSYEDCVILILQTKDVEDVTDIDKEFAKYADIIFKDIVYS